MYFIHNIVDMPVEYNRNINKGSDNEWHNQGE